MIVLHFLKKQKQKQTFYFSIDFEELTTESGFLVLEVTSITKQSKNIERQGEETHIFNPFLQKEMRYLCLYIMFIAYIQ